MTDIEAKALALLNEIKVERGKLVYYDVINRNHDVVHEALCRAVEQHEAFKQEVSDAVKEALKYINRNRTHEAASAICNFVIRNPDPLVDVVHEVDNGPAWDSHEDYCNKIHKALEARGLEIREKNDD